MWAVRSRAGPFLAKALIMDCGLVSRRRRAYVGYINGHATEVVRKGEAMEVRQFPEQSRARVNAEVLLLEDDGTFPNNAHLPVLVYARGLSLPPFDASLAVAALFNQHRWSGCWVSGVYAYAHFHSTAHEALGVVAGEARLRLGGDRGRSIGIRPGDLLILPAGVAHECRSASDDFSVVGAYPTGQRPDLCTGAEGERPGVDHNIARVPLPALDPLYGEDGAIQQFWQS